MGNVDSMLKGSVKHGSAGQQAVTYDHSLHQFADVIANYVP